MLNEDIELRAHLNSIRWAKGRG